jgi:nucleotide-binding universal stress UspA family protein
MKILLATDGSPGAREACWLLAHLPCREQESLLILSVVPVPSSVGASDVYPPLVDLTETHRMHSDADLADAAQMFEGFPGQVTTMQRTGHVPSEILQTAAEAEVDLIVLGAHGHSALTRLVLGSVSDTVATHAETSVLVVRPGIKEQPPTHDLRVMLAVDDSPTSRVLIREFKKFTWGPHVQVQVVSVSSSTHLYRQDLAIDLSHHLQEEREAARRYAAEVAEELRSVAPKVEVRVLSGDHVGQTLVEAAAEFQSDIVVCGGTRGGALKRFLLGSSSKYVLRHAECSVWIVRGAGETPSENADEAR